MRILLLLLVAYTGWGQAVPNKITFKRAAGQTTLAGPVVVPRFFKQGEIPDKAVAQINGQVVATQLTVRTRWSDGSLKHGIFSYVVDLTSAPSQDAYFVPGTPVTGSFTSHPSLANADASISLLSGGTTQTASLSAMLEHGNVLWGGPLAQTTLYEDLSTGLQFDLSFNGFKSFHPRFAVTKFADWPGMRVDFVGENVWTNAEQDITYSLELRGSLTGSDMPILFSRPDFLHYSRSRWRQSFWLGTPAPDFDIDHNLAYLIWSGAVPNFDQTLQLPTSAITAEVNAFNATDKGVMGGFGQWNKYFPTTGGRPDIGIFPRWDVRYLFSAGSRQLRDIVLANAGVSGHIPIHLRESALNGRVYHPQAPVTAFGKQISFDARPTFFGLQNGGSGADKIVPVGPATKGGWAVDLAHQPNFAYIAYLITGDWYLWEEMVFWAAHNSVWGNPGKCYYCSPWSIINDQIRGDAWGLRVIGEVAALAPDGSPEKIYFTEKLNNSVAAYEGRHNIRDGLYTPCTTNPYNINTEQSRWCFGYNTLRVLSGDNPLRYWKSSSSPPEANIVDPTKVQGVTSPWMENFIFPVLAHIEELGFPQMRKLRNVYGQHILSQVIDPAWGPDLIPSYRIPMIELSTGTYYSSWTTARDSFTASYLAGATARFNQSVTDLEHGYANIARAALAVSATSPSDPAWTAFQQRWAATGVNPAANPKWAIVPRPGSTSAKPTNLTVTIHD